jgi:hypothetical protein
MLGLPKASWCRGAAPVSDAQEGPHPHATHLTRWVVPACFSSSVMRERSAASCSAWAAAEASDTSR